MIRPWLMSTNPALLRSFASESNADRRPDAVIVDWERNGKAQRQQHAQDSMGFEPSIGTDLPAELGDVRAAFDGRLIVRTNPISPSLAEELAAARRGGVDDVLIPMIRSPHDIDLVRNLAGPALGVGVMIETLDAVHNLDALVERRPDFCFIGLVDLAIERNTSSLFAPIVDSLLDRIASALRDAAIPFGFGGMTLPGFGAPVPVELLVGEMCRLGGSFGVLRRSFLSDLGSKPPGDALKAINEVVCRLSERTAEAVERDRFALLSAILLVSADPVAFQPDVAPGTP